MSAVVATAGWNAVLLSTGLTLLCAIAGAAQEDEELLGTWAEGPLQNDVFLPTSAEAEALLLAGDAALTDSLRARAVGRDADADRLQSEAFEAWHASLSPPAQPEPLPLESVWVEGPDAPERRTAEGRVAAVRRRLLGLSEAERALWRARFEPVAAAEFDPGSDAPGALEALFQQHPGTLTAVRAALIAGDRAYERGRLERARLFWTRADAEAEWIGPQAASLVAALAQRPRSGASPGTTAGAQAGAAWRTATTLVPRGSVSLPDLESRLAPHRLPPVNAGSRPGLAFLEDGRFAVQTTSRVHLVRFDAARKQIEEESVFEPAELLPGFRPQLDVRRLGRQEPGWVNAPAAYAGDLFLVVGRADDGPNALFCLRPPADRRGVLRPTVETYLPRLRWAILGDERIDAAGGATKIPGLAAFADAERLELQPGPVVAGDLVLVQARELATDTRAWLLAFDRVSGELVWKSFLAQGSDLVPSIGRIGTGIQSRLAAQPLLALGDVVFAGTHLGAGVLVDLVDGRALWSLKNRRKEVGAPGWDGRRPVPFPETEDGPGFLWGPIDSDRLYALAARALEGPDVAASVHAGPIRPLENAELLIGGSSTAVVLQGRAGAEETVMEWRAPGTGSLDALYLGPDERFEGRGLVTPERVYACSSRGVYLFDRSRELYLLDYAALAPGRGVSTGGDLHARGSLVLALSRDGLWAFEAR